MRRWFSCTLLLSLAFLLGCGSKTDSNDPNGDLSGGGQQAIQTDRSFYHTSQHVGVWILRPSRLMASPLLAALPIENNVKNISQQMGIDPRKIDQIQIYFHQETIPNVGSVVREPAMAATFTESVDVNSLLGTILEGESTTEDYKGVTLNVGSQKTDPQGPLSVVVVSQQKLLIARKRDMIAILDSDSKNDALQSQLQKVDSNRAMILAGNLETVRSQIDSLMQEAKGAGQIPPMLVGFADLPTSTKQGVISLDLDAASMLDIQLEGYDEEAGKKIEMMLGAVKGVLQFGMMGAQKQIRGALPPETANTVLGVANEFIGGLQTVRDGSSVKTSAKRPQNLDTAVEQLAPTIQAMQQQQQASVGQLGNMKRLGLAFHNFHASYGKFAPSANYDGSGQPLLSWRVHLLPFLDQMGLYEQFKLDEPWNSPHNSSLIGKMPSVFSVSEVPEPGYTSVHVFSGEGMPFGPQKEANGPRMQQFADGTSFTILAAQIGADKAVPWTQPGAIPVDPADPWPSFGQLSGADFTALMADGAARRIPRSLKPEDLKGLLTPAGSEVVTNF